MNWTTIIIGSIPLIIYIIVVLLVNMYIKHKIVRKAEREKYKKEIKLKIVYADFGATMGSASALFVAFSSFKIEGDVSAFIILFIKFIVLLSYLWLTYTSIDLLYSNVKLLEKK